MPEENATRRTTLREPPDFTIPLSCCTLDAPQAIPLKYISIERDEIFHNYYCRKICLTGKMTI